MSTKTPQEMADEVIKHLQQPEIRQRLQREQERLDAYFKQLHKDLTPSWEDLNRPFTI
jgi:hypothetical protein